MAGWRGGDWEEAGDEGTEGVNRGIGKYEKGTEELEELKKE